MGSNFVFQTGITGLPSSCCLVYIVHALWEWYHSNNNGSHMTGQTVALILSSQKGEEIDNTVILRLRLAQALFTSCIVTMCQYHCVLCWSLLCVACVYSLVGHLFIMLLGMVVWISAWCWLPMELILLNLMRYVCNGCVLGRILLLQMGKSACHYAAEYGHSHTLQYLYDYVVSVITPPILVKVSAKVLVCVVILSTPV